MITVLFKTESHFPVDAQAIKDAVTKSLDLRVQSDTEVSISIVGDRRMKMLNSLYRKIETTTDVLSFPQNDPSQPTTPFVPPPDGMIRLGDIVVSYPQAVIEAGKTTYWFWIKLLSSYFMDWSICLVITMRSKIIWLFIEHIDRKL